MTQKLTVKAVMAMCRAIGCAARFTDGEWRINIKGAPEARAYYTNDHEDALSTARSMVAFTKRQLLVHTQPGTETLQ